MQKILVGFLPFILGSVLGVPSSLNGGWWDDIYEEQMVPLEKLRSAPDSFRGNSVSFIIQLHRPQVVANPYDTRFESDRYANLGAWSGDAALWEKSVYQKPFEHLFVRRDSEAAKQLLSAPMYSRWMVIAEVSEVFNGAPWIEIKRVRRISTQIDEPSLVRIVKGFMLRDLRRFDAAASEFRNADRPELPPHVRSMVMREEGVALHNAKHTDLAVARLVAAARLFPNDPLTQGALLAAKEALGNGTRTGDLVADPLRERTALATPKDLEQPAAPSPVPSKMPRVEVPAEATPPSPPGIRRFAPTPKVDSPTPFSSEPAPAPPKPVGPEGAGEEPARPEEEIRTEDPAQKAGSLAATSPRPADVLPRPVEAVSSMTHAPTPVENDRSSDTGGVRVAPDKVRGTGPAPAPPTPPVKVNQEFIVSAKEEPAVDEPSSKPTPSLAKPLPEVPTPPEVSEVTAGRVPKVEAPRPNAAPQEVKVNLEFIIPGEDPVVLPPTKGASVSPLEILKADLPEKVQPAPDLSRGPENPIPAPTSEVPIVESKEAEVPANAPVPETAPKVNHEFIFVAPPRTTTPVLPPAPSPPAKIIAPKNTPRRPLGRHAAGPLAPLSLPVTPTIDWRFIQPARQEP